MGRFSYLSPPGQIASIPLIAGSWYPADTAALGNVILVEATLYVTPVAFSRNHTFQAVNIAVTTAGAAGALARLGLWADNNGYPGALITDFGQVATTAIANVGFTTPIPLVAGTVYWLGVQGQGSPVTQATIRTNGGKASELMGTSTPNNNVQTWSVAGSEGAMPNPFTGGGVLQALCPLIQLQA